MTLHIFRANAQPATKFSVEIDTPKGPRKLWTRFAARRTLPARCCSKRRIADNLIAHVYYDGVWFHCRRGKGCNAR
jgi:hypothetical protein